MEPQLLPDLEWLREQRDLERGWLRWRREHTNFADLIAIVATFFVAGFMTFALAAGRPIAIGLWTLVSGTTVWLWARRVIRFRRRTLIAESEIALAVVLSVDGPIRDSHHPARCRILVTGDEPLQADPARLRRLGDAVELHRDDDEITNWSAAAVARGDRGRVLRPFPIPWEFAGNHHTCLAQLDLKPDCTPGRAISRGDIIPVSLLRAREPAPVVTGGRGSFSSGCLDVAGWAGIVWPVIGLFAWVLNREAFVPKGPRYVPVTPVVPRKTHAVAMVPAPWAETHLDG